METVQQQLDRLLVAMTEGNTAKFNKMPEGQYLLAAAADPEVLVTIEAAQEPDRIVLQALIGTLSTVEAERMARAALVLSASSAAQGGPAVGLDDESRSLVAIRCLPLTIDPTEAGIVVMQFLTHAVELKAALVKGTILALVRGDEPPVEENMIRI